jgi:hypothetical protein
MACWSQGRGFLESLDPPHDAVMDFFQEWASAHNLFEGLPIYTPQLLRARRVVRAGNCRAAVETPGAGSAGSV